MADIQDMFDKYRQLKGKAAGDRIRQVGGGAAETLRTGRSAAETFAARAPQHDTMSAKEKIGARQGVVDSLAAQEQFAYTKEQEQRLKVLTENNALTKAILSYNASLRASAVSEANHVATLKERELEFAITDLNREYRDLVAPSKSTTDAWTRTRDGMIEREFAAAREDPGYSDFSDKDLLAAIRTQPADTGSMAAAMEAETQNLEPGQQRQFLRMAAQDMGISEDELLGAMDSSVATLLKHESYATKLRADEIERELNIKNLELAQAPTWAYGKAPDPSILAQAQQAAQQGPVMGGQGEPAMGPEGEPVFETDPAKWTGAFGVQNVKPAGEGYERTIQTLDMIDQYPEHPPLQEARQAIMASPEFQQFQQARGYEDPKFAFKEMNREMRLKRKERLQASKTNKRVNVQDGSAPAAGSGQPSGLRSRVRSEQAKRTAAIVSGSDSGPE